MTRATKMGRKTHLEDSTFESKPLMPTKSELQQQKATAAAAAAASSAGAAAAAPSSTSTTNGSIPAPAAPSVPPNATPATNGTPNKPKKNKKAGNAGKRKRADRDDSSASAPAAAATTTDSAPSPAPANPPAPPSDAPAPAASFSASPVPNGTTKASGNDGADPQAATAAAAGNKGSSAQKKRRKPDQDEDPEKAERLKRQRKERRQAKKKKSTICFHCRAPGHSIKECPSLSGSAPTSPRPGADGTITTATPPAGSNKVRCYLCGSYDHTTKTCPDRAKAKMDERGAVIYPYATCFVCSATGHLASQCPKNERGVYPNGGSCKYCGSVWHLWKDCKPTANAEAMTTVGKVVPGQSPDDDDVFVALDRQAKEKQARKRLRDAGAAGEGGTPAASVAGKPKKKVVSF
ncbi:hypothetical protein AMAG_14632 [Allomyces macrogynus ATCC 38327]|uniref:CCHC-type domain-containing protein n=1 Tax=Allomyces macrogynus (strain ATCC 38327) TaxID=578462 RepID=A0A0L0T6Z5_ALLM3|nr:hypothetical protein AMAG_14632 [Allomyces macrogynus ATCC 38327]|eukprot:KNE70507.1 hypothetical protein AMAG_14632 [Allomyces macrogynus ATCC 38327]